MEDQAEHEPVTVHRAGSIEISVVAAFLALNVILPIAFQDLYPFTSSPMFRDHPEAYCNYQVFTADGRELPAEDFQLHRHYDGNPVGVGTGIKPAPTFNQFGKVPPADSLRRHVQAILNDNDVYDEVTVVQEVIGPVDAQTVGVASRTKFRISRHEELVQ